MAERFATASTLLSAATTATMSEGESTASAVGSTAWAPDPWRGGQVHIPDDNNLHVCHGGQPRNTHTEYSHVGSKTTQLVHKAVRYLKRRMGSGADSVLLFSVAGTTAAIKCLQEIIGVALPSDDLRDHLAAQLRAKERWVVFIGPYEQHSNLLSWRLINLTVLRRALRPVPQSLRQIQHHQPLAPSPAATRVFVPGLRRSSRKAPRSVGVPWWWRHPGCARPTSFSRNWRIMETSSVLVNLVTV